MLNKIYNKISKIYKLPSCLQIEPTTSCNLNCIWCVYNKNKNPKRMSFEQFKTIIDQFPFLFILKFAGIGEFFTNKDFIKMISYLKKKRVFYSCFTTNFTILNDSEIDALVNSNINTIFVSIDGATKETYEKIRKGANFNTLINNIRKFQSRTKKSKPKLVIRMVMSNQNKHELFKMIDLAKELKIKKIHFQKLYENNELSLNREEYLHYKKRLLKYSNIKLKFSKFDKRPINKCLRALAVIYISAEGYVIPCSILAQREDYFQLIKKEGFGNVFKNSIKEIWNSQKYRNFRKHIINNKIPEICRRCPYYH